MMIKENREASVRVPAIGVTPDDDGILAPGRHGAREALQDPVE